jgi:hypothetical protein
MYRQMMEEVPEEDGSIFERYVVFPVRFARFVVCYL